MSHNWTLSWPGNFCTRCGAEDALENAIALGWYDPMSETWQSEDKRKLVGLCNEHCLPKLTEAEQVSIIKEMNEL